MIAIALLNGTFLDLSEASVRWESVNTLFEENALQNDYSFPFTLKLSDVNMRALGFINKPDVIKTKIKFDVILYLGDRSIPSVLIVNGCKRSGFSVNIAGGINGMSNSDKSLKLLNFITPTADGKIHRAHLSTYSHPDFDTILAFPPHYNPDFYGDNNPDFNGVVNRMETDVGALLVNDEDVGNKYCHVPFLYIYYILKTIFDENGLKMLGSFAIDPEMKTALLYNNYACDKREEQGCIVKAASFFIFDFPCDTDHGDGHVVTWTETSKFIYLSDSPTIPGTKDEDNNWNSVYANEYSIPSDGDYEAIFEVVVDNYSPEYSASGSIDIIYEDPLSVQTIIGTESFDEGGPFDLKVLGSIAGAEATGKIYAQIKNTTEGISGVPDTDRSFIVTFRIGKGATLTITRTDVADFNIMDTDVTISNHVPDITVATFLKALKNWPQLDFNFDWNNKIVYINFAEKTLAGPPEIDLTALADPFPEQIFDAHGKGFTLNYDFGNSDALLEGNFNEIDPSINVSTHDTDLSLPTPIKIGDIAFIKNKNKFMQVQSIESVLTWVDYSDNYYPITVGKGEVELKIELAPMLMTTLAENESITDNANHKKALMPTIREAGNSELFNLGTTNQPSLRVVFHRGLNQTTAVGGNYILASSTTIDLNGNTVGNYNLKLSDDDGWYSRFLEKILLAIDGSEIFEYLINLPVSYLKYRGKVQINYVNYLVKTISMQISKTVKPSVVKLLKL